MQYISSKKNIQDLNIDLLTNHNIDLSDLNIHFHDKKYYDEVIDDFIKYVKKNKKVPDSNLKDIKNEKLVNELASSYKKDRPAYENNIIKLNELLQQKAGYDLSDMPLDIDDIDDIPSSISNQGSRVNPSPSPPIPVDQDRDSEAEYGIKSRGGTEPPPDPHHSPIQSQNSFVTPESVQNNIPSALGPPPAVNHQPTIVPPKFPPIKPLTASRPSSSSPGMLGTCGQCNNCLSCLPYMLNYALFSEFYRPLKIMDILLMAFSVFPFIGWYFDIVMIFKALVERRYIYAIYSSINLYQWFFWRMWGLHIDWGPMIKILYIGAVGSNEFTIDYISNMLFGGIYSQLQNLRGAISVTPAMS